jgi:uncharacterized protein (TIGR00106 family)
VAIVAVSVVPIGTGSTSVSTFVAGAEKILREDKRVRYSLGPMFTTIEGDLIDCLDVVRKMHESLFSRGAQRVSTLVKIDDRRDRATGMERKVRSVEEKLAEER